MFSRRSTERLLQLLYPPTCILCGAPGRSDMDLCAGCFDELPWNQHHCEHCALPLPIALPEGILCGQCQRHPPIYALCRTAFRYEGPLPALISGLKFHQRLHLARVLGQCLATAIRDQIADFPSVLIPVPLHVRRLRERGYNQAAEIARQVGRDLDIPLDESSCLRIGASAPQAGLEKAERRRNVRGVFALRRPPAVDHVAIVDDVVTTGSTVSELTKVLLKAGVQRVDILAVARTP